MRELSKQMRVVCSSQSGAMLLLAVLLFLSAFSLGANAQSISSEKLEEVTLHLKYFHAFQFAGYYAAKDHGYYQAEGLDVTINEASPDNLAVEATLAGRAQYGVEGSALLNARLSGKPLVVLAAIFQHSPYVIMARRDSGIRTPEDLAGRNIMISGRMGGAQFQAILNKAGISTNEVTITQYNWSIKDIINGTVDATMVYVTDQPNRMREVGIEPFVIHPRYYGIDFYGDCLFTTESEIEEHPLRVEAFRSASLKGWEYAMTHVDEMIDLILALPGTKERGLTAEHLRYEAEQMQALILPNLIKIGHINPVRWRQTADIYVEIGLLDPDYSLKGFIYNAAPVEGNKWHCEFCVSLIVTSFLAIIIFIWALYLRRVVRRKTRDLQESEVLFRALHNATFEGIIFHEKGIIIDCNKAIEKMSGYTAKELIRKDGLILIAEKDRETIKHNIAVGNEKPYEVVGLRKNGEEYPLEIHPQKLIYKGRKIRVVEFKDLSKSKKMEGDLKETEKKLSVLTTNTLDVIWTTDLELNVTYINNAVYKFVGYTPEEFINMTLPERTLPEYITVLQSEAEKLVTNYKDGKLEQKSAEIKQRKKDGTIIDVEVTANLLLDNDGKVIGFQGRSLDITERKEKAKERERLTTAIEQATDTIVITDSKGIIQYVNPAFEKITGYSREEAIGKNPNILQSGEQDKEFYINMWDTIKQGKTWTGCFLNKKKDNTLYTEEATISPVKDVVGNIVNYVAIKTDVTEKLLKEDQLQHAHKLESTGQFAGGIAHDFNNLLMAVMGYIELCNAEVEPDHPVIKWLDQITTTLNKSANTTSQLLAFARKQTITPKELDLNTSIDESLKLIRQMVGENIDLIWMPSVKLWSINMDPGQVDQVLSNLCINASDAIKGAGKIIVETRNITIDSEYCLVHAEATVGDYVMLKVSDNGEGIDEETMKNLFDPFFTT
ncbi:MAG: PAS domain S-box protein, partial [Kiritimatiellae bacterium]|nr:PAS domain S-box protein [Kiritimatiellia bacterium]